MPNDRRTGNVKCHKCRHILLEDMNGTYTSVCSKSCASNNNKNFVYLVEDNLPAWIKQKVEEEQWTKGKLHCESCKSKLGSFDFVSGRKCDCGDSVLPPVYLVTSQVDIPISLPNLYK
ncbi:unnamed protein product [Euphydryas editha]|uniref:E3 ubiquitin-protein ligase RNF180 n=1 Tax=Euphydryas editha TaxID=104508 RepID=A0AAU9ULN1_EUPED|nr:unnamed protein product [Euphydryas editha]